MTKWAGHEARQSATTWRDATHDDLSGANWGGIAILGHERAGGVMELEVQREVTVGRGNDGVGLTDPDRCVGGDVALPLPVELLCCSMVTPM